MTKLIYILFSLYLFSCNHPESKDCKRYKNTNTEETLNTESNTVTISYKFVGIKD